MNLDMVMSHLPMDVPDQQPSIAVHSCRLVDVDNLDRASGLSNLHRACAIVLKLWLQALERRKRPP